MAFSAVVPVRAGSKGLPGKNLRPLAGVPLWRRAVDQAIAAGADRVIVSTDSQEILAADVPDNVTLLPRPLELATDSTPMAPVVTHAIEAEDLIGPLCLLQCTSPLRTPEDISRGLDRFARGDVDLVMSVTEAESGVLKYGTCEDGYFRALRDPAHPFTNRQNLPAVHRPNGAVYVFDAAWFLSNGGFESERIGALIMPPERSDDVDTEEDFLRIEAALRRQ